MTEYKVTLADNGYIVEYDNFKEVYMSSFADGDGMPLKMMECLLAELIDSINHDPRPEFTVTINVDPPLNTDEL